jgi:hypothetical protein
LGEKITPKTIFIPHNFEHLSKIAAEITKNHLAELSKKKKKIVLGACHGKLANRDV